MIDTETNSVIGTFVTGNSGRAYGSIAVGPAPDGTLYITDTGNNTLYAVSVDDVT